MADISMCNNEECAKNTQCYRFTAIVNEYHQSYCDQKPDEDGNCEWFWDNTGRRSRFSDIVRYYEREKPIDLDYIDEAGVRLGNIWKAMDEVFIYTNEDKFVLLMAKISAKVAGVERIMICDTKPLKRLEDNNIVIYEPEDWPSIYDFMKRFSLIGCTKESFDKIAKNTEIMANSEGLEAHALSIRVRM